MKPGRLLCAIVGLRAILSIVLWNHAGGFFWLTADDASRMEMAYYWSQGLFVFNLPGNPFWLPLGAWVHGLALRFVDDPLAMSSGVNSAFSLASTVLMYALTQALFPGTLFPPLLAAGVFAFCPLLVWLGLSGLSEPIFHFFVLTSVFFLLRADHDKQPRAFLYASIGFLMASAIRYEAWILVVMFVLYCAAQLKQSQHKLTVLSSGVLAGLFIPIWLFWQWRVYGDALHFIRFFSSTSAALGVSPYFRLLWEISPPILLLAVLGMLMALRLPGHWRYLGFVALYYCSLMVTTRGIVAANYPVRNLTSVFILVIPYAAYALHAIAARVRFYRTVASLALLACIVGGTLQSFGYGFQARDGVAEAAAWSRRLIRTGVLDGGLILIETRRGGAHEQDVVWDSHVLHAVNPGRIVYDRVANWVHKDGGYVLESDGPSMLDGAPDDVEKRLRLASIQVVIAYSDTVIGALGTFMTPVKQCEEYHIYAWPDDPRITVATGPARKCQSTGPR